MNRNEWIDERRKGIGGTDVAAICGLHPYRSALDVYLDKLGIAPHVEDNAAMKWGRIMEPIIAQEVTAATGIQFQEAEFLRKPDNEVLCGTPDYWNQYQRVLLECKTAGLRQAHLWGDDQTDEVPMPYLTQVLWYLELTGYDEAKLAVLIGGNDFRMYSIKRDDDLQAALVDRAMKFWRDHIETMTPPPLDGSDSAKAWLKQAYPRHTSETLETATEDQADQMRLVAGLKRDLEKAEEQYETAKVRLCDCIGDRAGLISSDGLKVTWKATKGSDKVDYKGIVATLNPPIEVIRQHTTYTEGSRRFLLSEVKAK